MKTKLLFTCILGTSLGSFGQLVQDSIEMTPGYTNESYYSLDNDEQANIDNTTWDLAFDLSGFGSSIRTNEHTGTEIFVYPNGTDWMNVDTSGVSMNTMHNSEETWSIGALDQSNDPSNGFDLGWGVYNQITHHINGDSIHIVKLASGTYKKLKIESLIGGMYTFKHADLDGSNEVSATVTKNDYTDKNFAYYSISNDQTLDREPTNNSWDIVFTKYAAELGPNLFYGVTGALSNNGVYVREANGVDPSTAVYTDYTVDSVINVIGYDWKSFNMSTFSYDIAPDLSYFVQDLSGNIWHLLFTKFEGSSTGKVVFGKEKVATAGIEEFEDIKSFGIYPNPTSETANIIFNASSNDVKMTITDMNGNILREDQMTGSGFQTEKINVSEFSKGMYFVHLSTSSERRTQRLVIQ